MEKPNMHILMILEELNGKDFHQGGIITLVSGGGLVPENAFNGSALEDLLNAGVLGLKMMVNNRSIITTRYKPCALCA
ncbi:unnamed protein product [Prunus armeniaca]|uniref:Uncharacterized protein n=1 Tax=Prunus armeniaca TaxID=36596 RepID=A0A6J5Y0K2_PRUAR|nr:unnamed protein product [Prunus armeniaca]